MIRMRAVLLLLALSGCNRDNANEQQPGASANTPGFAYETVTTGLIVPWAIEFAPDGRVFVTERPGRIRVLRDWKLDPQPWATIPDIIAAGESGLMGLALSPDFAADHHVFVVATFIDKSVIINRVIRFRDVDGRGVEPTTIVDNIPAAEFHAGDAIEFGPDGMLYIATGDAGVPGNADDLGSLSGKILRYTPDGGIPPDNPFPGSPVWALGLRNVQGLAWNPDTGQLFATDHGPSGFPNERFRRNNDELNLIVRGQNYGWPSAAGREAIERFVQPLTVWTPGIAPSGLAVYSGPIAGWKGNLFVGGLRGEQLRRVVLRPGGSGEQPKVDDEDALFQDELGRIRAVSMGPDGFLYFATSNWDGRGDPAATDDRILRLVPRR